MIKEQGKPWWRISFRLSPWSITSTLALLLFSIGLFLFLWLPKTGTLLIIGCLWFQATAYYLGMLIEQFNLRRKGILLLALLMLALSLLSYISAWHFFYNTGNGRFVMMAITTAFWLPFYLCEAYSLLSANNEAYFCREHLGC